MQITKLCVKRLTSKKPQTAAESPWSNGLFKRHNGILKQSVKKVMEDTKCSLETAVSWAVSAKSTLHGHIGYTPNTIVF